MANNIRGEKLSEDNADSITMSRYLVMNGPMPTTAAQAPVTTTAAIRTMLQLRPFNEAKIIRWGISFDAFAAALPVRVELLETGTVFATVTASTDTSCYRQSGGAVASVAGLTLGTTGTGYTATAEGTITEVRQFDTQFVPPAGSWVWAFPLGQEPILTIGNACRIRVTAGTAVNAYCWIEVEI